MTSSAIEFMDSIIGQTFVEKFPLPLAVAINEKIYAANKSYAQLAGYDSPADLRGMPCIDFIHPDDRERFLSINKNMHTGLENGQTYRWKYAAGGKIRIVEGHPTVFKIKNDVVLISYLRDITESVMRQEELKREKNSLEEENLRLWQKIGERAGICLAESPHMRLLMHRIIKLAKSEASIVLLGETGTGKTMLANIIHDISPRRHKAFVVVNCAAIPAQLLESEFFGAVKGAFTGATANRDGYMAAADGGTLFLDEVGELSPAMQAKLLHALERKKYKPVGSNVEKISDARLVCATNRDLRELLKEGKLREDFYYRIFVGDIHIPPLRDRPEDIPGLMEFFLARSGLSIRAQDMPKKVMRSLMQYSWPGNLRELHNVLLRYAITGELNIHSETSGQKKTLPTSPSGFDDMGEEYDLQACLNMAEKQCLQRALAKTGGRKDLAARLVGLNLRTFHRHCARFGL